VTMTTALPRWRRRLPAFRHNALVFESRLPVGLVRQQQGWVRRQGRATRALLLARSALPGGSPGGVELDFF